MVYYSPHETNKLDYGCPSGARTQDTAVNSRMLVPTELRGNIRKERRFAYIKAHKGNALKKSAKKMLMATRRGLEPLTSAVTGQRSALLN